MDSVSSFFQWENEEGGGSQRSHIKSSSSSSLPFDFNFFNHNNPSSADDDTQQQIQSQQTGGSSQNDPDTSISSPSTKINKNSPISTKQKQQNYMSQQLTDKLIEKLFSIALPPSSEVAADALEGRVQAGKLRPGLSVQTMSRNFIQLNSRLSFPFELIDKIIKFFNWDNPKLTLTILVIYTHLILKPMAMLFALPFFLIVIYIMVPAYTLVHQPENHSILGKSNPILAEGPQLNEIEIPKPAHEISREFILNLTDLQNHMLLYVIAWDFINNLLSKFAYFIDESISSFFYLSFLSIGLGFYLFIDKIWWLIPFKFLLISFGWGLTIIFHPLYKDFFFNLIYSERTRYYFLNKTNKFESILEENFGFIEPQEQREVEIFEIQKFDKESKEWNFFCYLNNDFTKLSQKRLNCKYHNHINNNNYNNFDMIGTNQIQNVKPPKDWDFIKNDQWKIDLNPENWVQQNLLNDFVKIDNETKWVYDLDKNDFKGEFRRRRWIRSVTRFSEIEFNKHQNENDVDQDQQQASHSPTTSHFELDSSRTYSS
ncbi:Peroxisomal membrane protein PEX29 [Wickerhamomyces ciferrii]|uniref:Peroxisomal membrane protein PEX29 n=1 Tax=Wickerhamomyces ciferrii (strain ATCC 14091 / BCRC 22168 / CBS 111 / JCM 3599 / NBRC 0793 / NRRL Y-1031 F-60-10) TaxID=1206466 RepID=K0KTD1_WICCF|nr:Peroxisomal membrane protein PEX29 [Wickerhamomyces ciferrii]CCH44634.1 Peroxisomal membrane protein PEX29 [Wickerhamomyces ciferrii]